MHALKQNARGKLRKREIIVIIIRKQTDNMSQRRLKIKMDAGPVCGLQFTNVGNLSDSGSSRPLRLNLAHRNESIVFTSRSQNFLDRIYLIHFISNFTSGLG